MSAPHQAVLDLVAAAEALALAAERAREAAEQADGLLELADLPDVTAALGQAGASMARTYHQLSEQVGSVRSKATEKRAYDPATGALPEALASAGRAGELMASRGHDLGFEMVVVPLEAQVEVAGVLLSVEEQDAGPGEAFRVRRADADPAAVIAASWAQLPSALGQAAGARLNEQLTAEAVGRVAAALDGERDRRRARKAWTQAHGARAVRDALRDVHRVGDRIVPALAEGLALLEQDTAPAGALVFDRRDWGEPRSAGEKACLATAERLLAEGSELLAAQQRWLLHAACESAATLQEVEERIRDAAVPVGQRALPALLDRLSDEGVLERSVDLQAGTRWQAIGSTPEL